MPPFLAAVRANSRLFARAPVERNRVGRRARGEQRIVRGRDAIGKDQRIEIDVPAGAVDLALGALDHDRAGVHPMQFALGRPCARRVVDRIPRACRRRA